MTTYHLEYRKADNDPWQPYITLQRAGFSYMWFTSERAAVQYALNSADPRLAHQFKVVEASSATKLPTEE